MEEQKDFSVPIKWVDRLFEVMEEIYKEDWISFQGNPKKKDIYKTVWQHGLHGLTAIEIKDTLSYLRNSCLKTKPPLVTEFFHYAKGKLKIAHKDSLPEVKVDKELARRSIDQIKDKLRGKTHV